MGLEFILAVALSTAPAQVPKELPIQRPSYAYCREEDIMPELVVIGKSPDYEPPTPPRGVGNKSRYYPIRV
jgi:hypothetical protein